MLIATAREPGFQNLAGSGIDEIGFYRLFDGDNPSEPGLPEVNLNEVPGDGTALVRVVYYQRPLAPQVGPDQAAAALTTSIPRLLISPW